MVSFTIICTYFVKVSQNEVKCSIKAVIDSQWPKMKSNALSNKAVDRPTVAMPVHKQGFQGSQRTLRT